MAEKTPEISATSRRSCGNAVAADAEKGKKNGNAKKFREAKFFGAEKGWPNHGPKRGKKIANAKKFREAKFFGAENGRPSQTTWGGLGGRSPPQLNLH